VIAISRCPGPQFVKTLSLHASGLTCIKGERLLFADLAFSCKAGEGLEIMGPNGIGKTSLLRIIAGLARPESGTIHIDGTDQDGAGQAIEFTATKDGLKAGLSLLEHLAFWRSMAVSGSSLQSDSALLAAVGLEAQADLPAGVLSSGQKRRLLMARTMLQQRPVLLMDEPLNALDEQGQALLKTLLANRLAAGAIAIIATHQSLGLPGLKPFALHTA
jgi:heme exporter protein A